MVLKVSLNTGINRIRLEFKADLILAVMISFTVLIESDWNLKVLDSSNEVRKIEVLIESDWNLKALNWRTG